MVRAEVGVGEEPERAESVVERDHHHVAAGREGRGVVEQVRAAALAEAAAVDPHHHRSRARPGSGVQTLSERQSSEYPASVRRYSSPGIWGDIGP